MQGRDPLPSPLLFSRIPLNDIMATRYAMTQSEAVLIGRGDARITCEHITP